VSQLELLRDKLSELELLQGDPLAALASASDDNPMSSRVRGPSIGAEKERSHHVSNTSNVTNNNSQNVSSVRPTNSGDKLESSNSANFATASPSKQFLRRSNPSNHHRLDSVGSRDKRAGGLNESGGGGGGGGGAGFGTNERDIHGFLVKENKVAIAAQDITISLDDTHGPVAVETLAGNAPERGVAFSLAGSAKVLLRSFSVFLFLFLLSFFFVFLICRNFLRRRPETAA
jgi:hypothetical protein